MGKGSDTRHVAIWVIAALGLVAIYVASWPVAAYFFPGSKPVGSMFIQQPQPEWMMIYRPLNWASGVNNHDNPLMDYYVWLQLKLIRSNVRR